MKPAPQRPGESAADFKARVKAAEEKWKARNQAVRSSGGTKAQNMGPGSGRAPVAGGAAPAPKPKVGGSMVKSPFSKASPSQRGGPRGMKTGGMVKGKK